MPRAALVISKTRRITLQTPVWVWYSGFLLAAFVSLCVFAVAFHYAAVEYAVLMAILMGVVVLGSTYHHPNALRIVEVGWLENQWHLILEQSHIQVSSMGTLQRVWRTPWWIVLSFSLSQNKSKQQHGEFKVWRSTCTPELWRALNKKLNRDQILGCTGTVKDAA